MTTHDDLVAKGADAIEDLLTMLGVDPDERPEHGGPSAAETLAAAVVQAAEAVQLREALELLRPAHHTPYADEDHQGGNCADIKLALVTQAHKAERVARRVREWCDKTMAAASGDQSEPVFQARMQLVDEVRGLLPAVSTEDASP